jgi:hypothetical protein
MSASSPNHEFDDELLSAYVDDELTAAERAAVDERLRTDERARQLLAELRAASEAVKALPRMTLGRDLAGSVLAAIESRPPAAEPVSVLPLPQVDAERRPRGFRPLVWVSLAVAAALMLMVLRPADEPQATPQVAQGSAEKRIEAASAIEAKTEDRQLEERSSARTAMPQSRPLGEVRPDRSIVQSPAELAEPALPAASADAPAPAGDATTLAAAEPDNAAASPAPAASTVAAPAAAEGAIETVDVAIADDQGIETFESLLAAHDIALVETQASGDAPVPPDYRYADAAAVEGRIGDRDRVARAYLVEAAPEKMRALTDAVQSSLRLRDAGEAETAATQSRAGGGGFAGGGYGGGGALREGGRAGEAGQTFAGRAWRLIPTEKDSDLAKAVDALGPASPEGEGDRESDTAAVRGRAAAAGEAAPPQVRMVFVLRRESVAVPAAAAPQR